jgi:hypothetical protein
VKELYVAAFDHIEPPGTGLDPTNHPCTSLLPAQQMSGFPHTAVVIEKRKSFHAGRVSLLQNKKLSHPALITVW